MGAQSGVLQGERRWAPLSLIYLALGIPRLVIGVAFIAWQPTQTFAMLGIAVAAVCPGRRRVARAASPRRRTGRDARTPATAERRHPTRDILREAAHNSQALLAFFALSNADIIVARHALDNHQAGLYAAGLILTKAMLFLPQFVVVVAFPDHVDRARADGPRSSRSLGLVAVLGRPRHRRRAACSPGWPWSSSAARRTPRSSDQLWLFAVLGTVLSMLQLLVYAVLARSGRRAGLPRLGGVLAAIVGSGCRPSTRDRAAHDRAHRRQPRCCSRCC